MKFKRRKKRGQNQKVSKYWFCEEGYRIVWRTEICGVKVPARFHACVRAVVPCYGGRECEPFEMWDCVSNKPRLYKTLKAAEEDCERHRRKWAEACEATGVRGLTEIFGRLPTTIPLWAKKKLPRKVYDILTRPRSANHVEDECEPGSEGSSRTLDCSISPSDVMPANLPIASKAEGRAQNRNLTSSQPFPTSAKSSDAKSAKKAIKARKKPTGKPKPLTTAMNSSIGSRTTKSKLSKS